MLLALLLHVLAARGSTSAVSDTGSFTHVFEIAGRPLVLLHRPVHGTVQPGAYADYLRAVLATGRVANIESLNGSPRNAEAGWDPSTHAYSRAIPASLAFVGSLPAPRTVVITVDLRSRSGSYIDGVDSATIRGMEERLADASTMNALLGTRGPGEALFAAGKSAPHPVVRVTGQGRRAAAGATGQTLHGHLLDHRAQERGRPVTMPRNPAYLHLLSSVVGTTHAGRGRSEHHLAAQFFVDEGSLKSRLLHMLSDRDLARHLDTEGSAELCVLGMVAMNAMLAGHEVAVLDAAGERGRLRGTDFFHLVAGEAAQTPLATAGPVAVETVMITFQKSYEPLFGSEGAYMQMMGAVMRVEKKDFVTRDHAGFCLEHHFGEAQRALEKREAPLDAPLEAPLEAHAGTPLEAPLEAHAGTPVARRGEPVRSPGQGADGVAAAASCPEHLPGTGVGNDG